MPKFYVTFDGPVVDQPHHPKVARLIDVSGRLPVSAPNAQQAAFHAIKVTGTGANPLAVYDAAGVKVWGEGPDTLDLSPIAPPTPIDDTQEDDRHITPVIVVPHG